MTYTGHPSLGLGRDCVEISWRKYDTPNVQSSCLKRNADKLGESRAQRSEGRRGVQGYSDGQCPPGARVGTCSSNAVGTGCSTSVRTSSHTRAVFCP
eukprot:14315241-Alexandrium_andersonii.AAC.1